MTTRTSFFGGNWKMHTSRASGVALARDIAAGARTLPHCDIALFPPFPYLLTIADVLATCARPILLGAQNCSDKPDGPLTGEVSAAMLTDCGARAVLVGHSERRHALGEPDSLVRAKAHTALNAGLACVLCIGETLNQREHGKTDEVNATQLRSALDGIAPDRLSRLVIAYEPVWAIGTGRNATPIDAQRAHAHIRSVLASIVGASAASTTRIIYGGSLKPANARDLLAQPDIDGGLVGGASLVAADFLAIIAACPNLPRA